jgi:tetrahydromethanopterin S-methyltransferase subunit C
MTFGRSVRSLFADLGAVAAWVSSRSGRETLRSLSWSGSGIAVPVIGRCQTLGGRAAAVIDSPSRTSLGPVPRRVCTCQWSLAGCGYGLGLAHLAELA